MKRRLKRKTRPVGLSPGTLVDLHEERRQVVKITRFDYNEKELQEQAIEILADVQVFRENDTVTWIDIDGLPTVDVLRQLGKTFSLHPLILEDILDSQHRPKLEDYDDYLYLVLQMLSFDSQHKQILVEQVNFILGPNFVVSVQEGNTGDLFEPVRERIRSARGKIRISGSDYLAYALIDAIVDHYFVILAQVAEEMDRLDSDLIEAPSPDTLAAIYSIRRELILLHKSIWPLRDVVHRLTWAESSLFAKPTVLFLRDVYDHISQVIDLVETYRDLVAGMLDLYLSSTSNRMNVIMKVLTIIATVFIPITFITSLYGMNFKYMPELDWQWGYPMVWLVVICITSVMLALFRIWKWF